MKSLNLLYQWPELCLVPIIRVLVKASTVINMYTFKEKDLDCGCCIELTVTKDDKSVIVVFNSIEEVIEKAKKELDLKKR